MKIGFIDLNQPSTWRGIVALAGLFGIAVSPELTDQIAIAIGAIFAGIEIYRDERKVAALPKIELQGRSDPVDRPVEQLRDDIPKKQPPPEKPERTTKNVQPSHRAEPNKPHADPRFPDGFGDH